MKTTLCALLSLLISAASMAQGETPPPKSKNADERLPGKLSEDEIEAGKTDAEIDRSNPFPGSRGYCIIRGSVQPRRIAPGGTGTVVLTMLLEKNFVMTSPANLEFDYLPEQGSIRVGRPVLRPAREGTLETMFKGQPVYDNYAVIDVPISVAPDAKFGEHHVRLKTIFDITNGTTGQLFQRFLEPTGAVVEVGEAIPENIAPRLQSGPDAVARPLPGSAGGGAAAPSLMSGNGAPETGRGPVAGRVLNPGPAEAGPSATAGQGPGAGTELGVDDQTPWGLYLAGAGFGLVLLVVLVRAARR